MKVARRYQPQRPAGRCAGCRKEFTGTPFEVEADSREHCETTGHEVRIPRTQVVSYTRAADAEEAEAC